MRESRPSPYHRHRRNLGSMRVDPYRNLYGRNGLHGETADPMSQRRYKFLPKPYNGSTEKKSPENGRKIWCLPVPGPSQAEEARGRERTITIPVANHKPA